MGLVDHYGSTFAAFILAWFELVAFCYIYGVRRVCKDVEFMLGFQPGMYWKACWYAITPIIMGAIVLYTLIFYEPPTDNGQDYPTVAHAVGWCITALGVMWLPLLLITEVIKQKKKNFIQVFYGNSIKFLTFFKTLHYIFFRN